MFFGFPGDKSHPSVLASEVPGFPQGYYHHDLKAFVKLSIIVYFEI